MFKLFVFSAIVLAIYQTLAVLLANNMIQVCQQSAVALFCK